MSGKGIEKLPKLPTGGLFVNGFPKLKSPSLKAKSGKDFFFLIKFLFRIIFLMQYTKMIVHFEFCKATIDIRAKRLILYDVIKYKPPCFSLPFGNLVLVVFGDEITKSLRNILFTLLLSKARQLKRKFKVKKIM